jgi:flagellar secretion chaperone FliS
MPNDSRVKQYSNTGVQTADQGKLLLMVYDVAINNLIDAQKMIAEGNFAEKGMKMDKALRAVGELRNSLDMEKGREIADSLDKLYDFMIRRMREANIKNDLAHLDVVVKILEDLRGTWQQVVKKHAGENSLSGPAVRKEGILA